MLVITFNISFYLPIIIPKLISTNYHIHTSFVTDRYPRYKLI